MAYIKGSINYERITGTGEDDIIDGAGGSDIIKTYFGNNTYLFNPKYGQYTLTDLNGNDKIVFGDGITVKDAQFFKYGNNLIIRIKGTTDKIDIQNWFDSKKDYKIEKLEFFDGTSLTAKEVESKVDYTTNVIIGTSENDIIDAPSGNNLIYSIDGNDSIYTHSGNNIVEPASGTDSIYNYGNGNDTMHSGSGSHYYEDYGGNDSYIFNQGFQSATINDTNGIDTIKFNGNIFKENLSFSKNQNDLVINIKNSAENDKIVVKNWFDTSNGTKEHKIEQLNFNNGNTMTSKEIDSLFGAITPPTTSEWDVVPTVTGSDQNDRYSGVDGNNIYYAKKGYDSIKDYSGNDIYLFANRDAWDIITDSDGNDTIKFGTGITKNNTSFSKEENDLIVKFANSDDGITIKSWFSNTKYQVEALQYKDGSSFKNLDINNIINGTPPINPVTPPNNEWDVVPTVTGSDQNDKYSGFDGNDIYYAKKGNDIIKDYSGNDIYLFAEGDGWDSITDSDGNDIIKLGAGITKNDVIFTKTDNNLSISLKNTEESITLNSWFSKPKYQIEKTELSDGSYMTNQDINLLIQEMSSFNEQKGIDMTNVAQVKANQELMTIMVNSWHN